MKVLKVPVANYKIITSEQQPQEVVDNLIWIKGIEKPYSIIANDFDFEQLLDGIYYIVYNNNGSLQFDAYADSVVKFNPLYVFIKESSLMSIIESYIYQQGIWSQLSETRIFSKGYLNTSDGTILPEFVLKDKIGYSNGNKIIGTIPSKEASIYIPKDTDQIIQANQYLTGPQTIKGDSALLKQNIVKGKTIFGVVGEASIMQQATGVVYQDLNSVAENIYVTMNLGFMPKIIIVSPMANPTGNNWVGAKPSNVTYGMATLYNPTLSWINGEVFPIKIYYSHNSSSTAYDRGVSVVIQSVSQSSFVINFTFEASGGSYAIGDKGTIYSRWTAIG